MDETKLWVRRRDGEAACDDGTYGHKGGEEGCRKMKMNDRGEAREECSYEKGVRRE